MAWLPGGLSLSQDSSLYLCVSRPGRLGRTEWISWDVTTLQTGDYRHFTVRRNTTDTEYNTMEGMEVDLQHAQIILQLRQMNIMDEGRQRERAAQHVNPSHLQQTGGADSGFNSDKVRNNGPH